MGPTDLLIFRGNMNAIFYVENILKDTYLQSAKRLYPDPEVHGEPMMWADNDPKHTSRLATNYCRVNNNNIFNCVGVGIHVYYI